MSSYNVRSNAGAGMGAVYARAAADDARNSASEVNSRMERLYMIVEALWGILKEQHGYTDAELIKRVALIDMKDGELDGRVRATEAPKCAQCGRTTSKHSMTCVFCGKPVLVDLFAR